MLHLFYKFRIEGRDMGPISNDHHRKCVSYFRKNVAALCYIDILKHNTGANLANLKVVISQAHILPLHSYPIKSRVNMSKNPHLGGGRTAVISRFA